jgi:hypothetical protein
MRLGLAGMRFSPLNQGQENDSTIARSEGSSTLTIHAVDDEIGKPELALLSTYQSL